jgi:hypothetical protein
MSAHNCTLVLVCTALFCAMQAYTDDLTAADVRLLGLEARLNPEHRDSKLTELAGALQELGTHDQATLAERQDDFQYALLLAVDMVVYETLAPDTIAAIDRALESFITLDEIGRSNRWEPLIYVYGFFNRDVTAQQIKDVAALWDNIPESEREVNYPTWPHSVDAVCKPLSMGPLLDPGETLPALERAVPLLKELLLHEPEPGRAFHMPSHAALVLGPLYDRWVDDPEAGKIVRRHLGSREAFNDLMAGRLLAAAEADPFMMPTWTHGFYAYSGRYLANGLARLDARNALPTLNETLIQYEKLGAAQTSIDYTRRALIALGDADQRRAMEGGDIAERMRLAVWFARNGKGETKTYGLDLLGTLLGVPSNEALRTWFEQERDRLLRTR